MDQDQRIVTIIPATKIQEQKALKRQLRVAAYCRVSTEEEEQQSSYEAQCTYYTDKIMSNPEWSLVRIFADEGLSGTSTEHRKDFKAMIKYCKQQKLDLILTKSISRFARNTLDTINYTRMLRAMGIGIYFEKENINTLDMDSEMLITLLGAFAQAESESISRNVAWGKRQAMREGKVSYHYKNFYGYRKGTDGKPEIVEEQAEVYRRIVKQLLDGYSLRNIRDKLIVDGVPYLEGKEWSVTTIRNMLSNEKYCGDALLQKTFVEDCISKKVVKNTGQREQVLVENCHPAIITRDQHKAVLAELARRSAIKSPSSKQASTGMACYSSKYALTERLVCGECGTLYRRCVWKRNGTEKVVWRCVSRLDYGTKYCHNSPTLEETALQTAILGVLNSVMSGKHTLIRLITEKMSQEIVLHPTDQESLGDIDRRLQELEEQFSRLLEADTIELTVDDRERFRIIAAEQAELKREKAELETQLREDRKAYDTIKVAEELMEDLSPQFTEWDEVTIRRLVHTVKVESSEWIEVTLTDGMSYRQKVENGIRKRKQ